MGAGGSCGPTGACRPAQRRTKGLSRVGGCEHDRIDHFTAGALATEPIDRTRQRKLCCAEAIDEVAATHLALFFERLQDGVDPGKAALGSFAQSRLASDDAVALKELQCLGMCGLGVRWSGLEQGSDKRPTARSGRRAGRPHPSRSRSAPLLRDALLLWQTLEVGPHRRKRVVGDLAGPHEVPQRGQHRGIVIADAGVGTGSDQLAPKRRTPCAEVFSNRVVDLLGWWFVARRNEQSGLVPKHQPDPPVTLTDRPGPYPGQFA